MPPLGSWLKLIGIAIFLWILSRLDLRELFGRSLEANPLLLGASFILVFVLYAVKALRWHLLVRIAGANPTVGSSWRVYNLGIFLGNITPGKLGEFGRIAYLKKDGIHPGTGTALVLLDRLFDVAFIALLGVGSVYVLFGIAWTLITAAALLFGVVLFFALWKGTKKIRADRAWLNFLNLLKHPKTFVTVTFLTLVGWFLYFAWALLIARSIGISIALAPLLSAITITGILSLLPIAPAGLGTRDAALLALLSPFGIAPAQAVTLSLLMFVSILLSSLLGGWYWLKDRDLR